MTEEVIDQPVIDQPVVAEVAPAPTETVVQEVEAVVQKVETALSDATHRVHAWIKSMAEIAPHHSQLTFEAFLSSNIASLETFVHKQGD